MARIKLGPVVTNIAGSIGGMTIQRNRFGMTMRAKPLPLYSETSAQYNVRRLIPYLQRSWQALSDADRLQWNRFLDFSGQTIKRDRSVLLSGYTLFLKYQLMLALFDESLLTDLVYAPMPAVTFLSFLAIDVGTLNLAFDAEIDHTSYFFLIKLSTPRIQARVFNPRGLRFMKIPLATQIIFNVTAPYIAAFGAIPPIDSWLHYSIRFFSVVSPVYTGVFTGKVHVVAA